MDPDDLFVPDTGLAPSATLKIPNKQQISISEPALQGVKQEDMNLVRNVIYLLHVCKHPARMCVSWSVANARSGDGYEVTGFLDSGKDFEVFKEDLDLISLANPLRVKSISVAGGLFADRHQSPLTQRASHDDRA